MKNLNIKVMDLNWEFMDIGPVPWIEEKTWRQRNNILFPNMILSLKVLHSKGTSWTF